MSKTKKTHPNPSFQHQHHFLFLLVSFYNPKAMASSTTCDREFSSNYMLLNPEDAKVFDLFRILSSKDIQKRNFVDCPESTDESFEHRWIIFVSIVAQKFIQFIGKPLGSFGSFVEYWLNLVSSNRNFGVLLLRFVRGTVVWPEKSSSSFLSFLGYIDKRVELDKSIKHGDDRYYAAVSVMAAKASYENKAYLETIVKEHWKMDFVGSYDFWNDYQEKHTTQAFMFHDKTGDSDVVILAFRGTEPFDADAWCTDLDISWYEIPGVGKMHGGFMKALGLQKNRGWPKEIDQYNDCSDLAYYSLRKILRQLLRENEKTKLIVTGHSLGGALAILFPTILAMHEESWMLERLEAIYTYGQPRVGDDKFREFIQEQLNKYGVQYYRFVYSNDIVPRLPYDDSSLMFKHFGNCIFYNSFYEGRVLEEEPNKNYFSLLWFIPKSINAFWELIRSFVIPYQKGPDYKEGSIMKMIRVLGLVIAGLPAHCPLEYINAIRLGPPDVFLPNKTTQQDDIVYKSE